ncbi:MAG TPA: SMC-Scp complex subunit ScpB [Ginsengibacter sp.]|nr:SMC-Scp complex subunit ScpB [Ginsengibacter sp.]HRP17448.1 SMC-Scp complex subunit ScpB [Ginsengibacter sp.]HRP44817.1 SMC-Scp complex subunit ScpB [Ginsengibacter sp.]
MELSVILPHIEALIFASDKPLAEEEIEEYVNRALAFMEDRTTADQVAEALNTIQEKYQSEFYPFEVIKSGGGWQFLSKKEYHATISLLYGDKFLKKLSVAALETLAIIAYEQPVTKSEIELIRGVNCDYAVQKLLEKELIVISGRKEDSPGKPLIYTTSKSFMDYFGINTSDDLPKIQEILNNEILEATRLMHSNTTVNSEVQTEEKDTTEQDTANSDSATEVANQDSGAVEEEDNT